ncbi:unnamed protein product, partial [Urochloa humidicola]
KERAEQGAFSEVSCLPIDRSRRRGVKSDGSRVAAAGEVGVRPAGRVRGDGGGGGAASGAQRADQDRALHPEESRTQGRPGPLGADRGGVGRGRVPRRAARPVPLHEPPRCRHRRRRRRQPATEQRDRGCAYMVFATTVAALQACFVGLVGVEALQWSKLCNIYTRFCEQAAAGMLCSMLAAGGMAILSAFSDRELFRRRRTGSSPASARQCAVRAGL